MQTRARRLLGDLIGPHRRAVAWALALLVGRTWPSWPGRCSSRTPSTPASRRRSRATRVRSRGRSWATRRRPPYRPRCARASCCSPDEWARICCSSPDVASSAARAAMSEASRSSISDQNGRMSCSHQTRWADTTLRSAAAGSASSARTPARTLACALGFSAAARNSRSTTSSGVAATAARSSSAVVVGPVGIGMRKSGWVPGRGTSGASTAAASATAVRSRPRSQDRW